MSYAARWNIVISGPGSDQLERTEDIPHALESAGFPYTGAEPDPATGGVRYIGEGTIYGGRPFHECHQMVVDALAELTKGMAITTSWVADDREWDCEYTKPAGNDKTVEIFVISEDGWKSERVQIPAAVADSGSQDRFIEWLYSTEGASSLDHLVDSSMFAAFVQTWPQDLEDDDG